MAEVFRHVPGGGAIRGIAAAVSSDSVLERGSEIRGKTFVSFLSEIQDKSTIIDSSIACSRTRRSMVVNSHVTYASVQDSYLEDVVVRGADDRADLQNVVLTNGVTVEGCRLRNFELSGSYLVHADFDRVPRHFDLKEFGIPLHIIECHHNGVLHGICGCKCRPIEEWIQKKERMRRLFTERLNQWEHGVVDYIHEHFKIWLREPGL